GGPAAHGVTDQDDRDVPGEAGQFPQRPLGVVDRVGVGAVPAADAVAHLRQQDVVGHGGGDGAHERPPPERRRVPGAGGGAAGVTPAVQEEDGRPRVSRGAPGPQRGGGTTRGAGRAWALVPWHVSPLLGGPGSPVGPVLGWAPFSWMCPVVPDAVRWPPDRVRQGLVRPVPLCRGAARGGGLRITRVYGCRVPPSGPVAARGPGRVVGPG